MCNGYYLDVQFHTACLLHVCIAVTCMVTHRDSSRKMPLILLHTDHKYSWGCNIISVILLKFSCVGTVDYQLIWINSTQTCMKSLYQGNRYDMCTDCLEHTSNMTK